MVEAERFTTQCELRQKEAPAPRAFTLLPNDTSRFWASIPSNHDRKATQTTEEGTITTKAENPSSPKPPGGHSTKHPSTSTASSCSAANAISCKECDRPLATISPSGSLLLTGAEEAGCDICRNLEALYADMERKDAAFAELQGRRFEHAGRQKALEEGKLAHIAFDNFLMRVEAALPQSTLQAEEAQHADARNTTVKTDENNWWQSNGRKRASAPLPESAPQKRARITSNGPRRVTFDCSVVFRDESERRPERVFNRASNDYQPGRNAPPEGTEYLDTSGLGVTPTRFFGIKKVGKKWVQTKEGKADDELWIGAGVSGDERDEVAGNMDDAKTATMGLSCGEKEEWEGQRADNGNIERTNPKEENRLEADERYT